MSKIRYTVRFYYQHDLDLITFFLTHEFNVMRGIYTSLTAFAKGEGFVIEIPPRRNDMPKPRRVYTKLLILDEEKDAEAVALLSMVKDGYRNNFLKNLLRQYLCCPLSEEFLEDNDDMAYFNGKFGVFREGKRKVKAGKVKTYTRRINQIKTDTEAKQETSSKPVAEKEEISRKQEMGNIPPQDKQEQNTEQIVQGKVVQDDKAAGDDNELYDMFAGML